MDATPTTDGSRGPEAPIPHDQQQTASHNVGTGTADTDRSPLVPLILSRGSNISSNAHVKLEEKDSSTQLLKTQPFTTEPSTMAAADMSQSYSVVSETELTPQILFDSMQNEKSKFKGAQHWAAEEERLFEILFLRNYLPILPSHWEIDLQGVPLPEYIFSTSLENPPVIYAHSDKAQFRGTNYLMKLIDLSSEVSTLIQSDVLDKVPLAIQRTIEQYVVWAAQDGGYDKLDIVPNLIVEILPLKGGEDRAFQYVGRRMRQLAQLHREFLAVDRDDNGWTCVKQEMLERGFRMAGSPSAASTPSRSAKKDRVIRNDVDMASDIFDSMAVHELTPQEKLARSMSRNRSRSPPNAPATPRKRSPIEQRAAAQRRKYMYSSASPGEAFRTPPRRIKNFFRTPPVVYAFFIIGHDVVLATIDAAKQGKEAQISWHETMEFNNVAQCIWNGLTAALAVCRARDEMLTRLDDFDILDRDAESDPDA